MSRMDKLNQLFKREIGNMILQGEISDPRVQFVTITYADISKDLSWAHVGFSVLNDDPNIVKAALEGLNSAQGRVRKLLSERLEIRYMPKVKFVYDNTIADSFRMSQTLEKIRQARLAQEGAPPGDAPGQLSTEKQETVRQED